MKNLDDDAEGDKPEWPGEPPFPRVAEILEILGPSTLLLHWPLGKKGTRKKWGHLTVESMASREYQRTLESGNIGVPLGVKSDRLCAVDLDRDDLRETFLELNEWARRTTEVRGQRGCKFFVRIRGDYPPTAHIFRRGEDVAQWLADGTQAIVSGTHPAGMDYVIVNRACPVEIEYAAIIWPAGLTVPRLKGDFTEHKKQQSVRASEPLRRGADEQAKHSSDGELEAVWVSMVVFAVQSAIPKAARQNNRLLFQLARSMRDLANKIGRPLSDAELRKVFELWAKDAQPFWRPGQSWDEYWWEFLDACERVRFGLDENPLPRALEAAQRAELPREAVEAVTDPRLRLLISFCHQMQLLSGDRPFFIPTRWLGECFNVSHTQAALWLRALRRLKFLIPDPAQPGTESRSPRYFYGPSGAPPN